jgi:hypothetical protein
VKERVWPEATAKLAAAPEVRSLTEADAMDRMIEAGAPSKVVLARPEPGPTAEVRRTVNVTRRVTEVAAARMLTKVTTASGPAEVTSAGGSAHVITARGSAGMTPAEPRSAHVSATKSAAAVTAATLAMSIGKSRCAHGKNGSERCRCQYNSIHSPVHDHSLRRRRGLPAARQYQLTSWTSEACVRF